MHLGTRNASRRNSSAAHLVRLFVLLFALSVFPTPRAATMTVDLGSDTLKVGIVQPTKTPISIVLNEMSKRKTAAAVAVVKGERLVGEDAAALAARFPEKVFTGFRDMLGKRFDDEILVDDLSRLRMPFEVVEAVSKSDDGNVVKAGRSSVAFQTDGDIGLSVEEAVASLFEYAASLSKEEAGGVAVSDVVVVVPAYYTPAQRYAIKQSAALAGLNVLSLVNSHAAAALQYGIERDFTDKRESIVFYDLGAKSAEAALVEFSSFEDDKGAKVSQFEVKDVAWVTHNAAGDALEAVLMDILVAKFDGDTGKGAEATGNTRAVAKLRKQAQKAKHVLSANTEVSFSIEDLLPGVDFRAQVTREEFEQAAEGVVARAVAPVKVIMARNNVTADGLAGVELIGGSSRVPMVKERLSEVLGGRSLDTHLDADEAMVLGAGYVAANLSTALRLRPFGMTDKSMFQIEYELDGAASSTGTLVPAMEKVPMSHPIKQENVTVDSFAVRMSWNNEHGAALDCCKIRESIGSVVVSGIDAVVEKRGFSGEVVLHTRMDAGGAFDVQRADATIEIDVEEKVAVEKGQGEKKDGEEEKGDADDAETETTTQIVRKLVKDRLTIDASLYPGVIMSEDDVRAAKKVLKEYRDMDRKKRELAKAKNDLEAYCISKSGSLNDEDSQLYAFSSVAEREKASKALMDAEDWIYSDEAEEASASAFRAKLSGVSALIDAIENRIHEAAARPDAMRAARSFAVESMSTVDSWAEKKPWITVEETDTVRKNITAFTTWLADKEAEQSETDKSKDPVVTVRQILVELDTVKKTFTRVNIKSKPIETKEVEETDSETKDETETTDQTEKTEKSDDEPTKEEEHDEL